MSEVPLHTTCGGTSFVPWKSPEPAARTCREQVGVGGTCIFESILQAGRAAYAKTGFLGFQVLIGEWFRQQNPGWRGNLFVLSRIGLQKRWVVRYVPLSLMALPGTALLNTPFFARSWVGYLRAKYAYALFSCNLQRDLCKMENENGLVLKTNTLGFTAARFSCVLRFCCG